MSRAPSRVEDFYTTGEEFEDTVRQAIRETDDNRGLDFLADVEEKWTKYGMSGYFSEKQNQLLRRLAGLEE